MEIRKLKYGADQDTYQACYELWSECFGDSKQYMDYYFTEKVKENQIYVLSDTHEVEAAQLLSPKVATMVQLNPFEMNVLGSKFMLHYIVGVATKKEQRSKGYMRMVLTKTLEEMQKAGEVFTYLMPAAKEIYLPYDFRYVYTQDRYKEVWNRNELGEVNAIARPYHAVTKDEKQQVLAFSNKMLAQEFDCYTVRTDRYYERTSLEMQAAGGEVLCIYQDEKVVGICSYMLEQGAMEITETICTAEITGTVIEAVKHQVFLKESEKTLKVTYLERHFFVEQNEQPKKQPIIMARILSVVKALELLRLKGEEQESISFIVEITDPIIKENNGRFETIVGKEKAEVKKSEKEPMYRMDIGEFTEFFFGVRIYDQITEKLKRCEKVYLNEIV